jgi:hypothetical protein
VGDVRGASSTADATARAPEATTLSPVHRRMLAAAELFGRVHIEDGWREERRACTELVRAGLLEGPSREDGCDVFVFVAAGRPLRAG